MTLKDAAISAKRKEAKKRNPFAGPDYKYKKPEGSGQELFSKQKPPSLRLMQELLTGGPKGLTSAEVRALSREQIETRYRAKLKSMNKGGTIMKKKPVKKLAKGGFPDLTGDGQVTKADVLKGRGVAMNMGGMKKKMPAYGKGGLKPAKSTYNMGGMKKQYGTTNYMYGGSVMGKKKK